jgi:hypothetical protein
MAPSGEQVDQHTGCDERGAEPQRKPGRLFYSSVLEGLEFLQKQSEASHDKTEAHQREASADPGEQRALGGKVIAEGGGRLTRGLAHPSMIRQRVLWDANAVLRSTERTGRIRSAERTEVHLSGHNSLHELTFALHMRTWAYERKFAMPVRRLPSNPNLNHLKHQAKDLLRNHGAGIPAAAQTIREFHPRFAAATDAEIFDAKLKLSDAQLTIAREAGFPSWARLKRHIEKPTLSDRLDLPHHERIEDTAFRSAVELLDKGDAAGLRAHLQKYPKLTRQRVVFEGGNYFRNPTLLEFIAENPVRHGKLPANIVEVAKVILEAGVERAALNETLMLVATGSVPRECGVQSTLIDLLCDSGADPDGAMEAAALHGELESVKALIRRGARVTLPIAAALGRVEDVARLLPTSDGKQRHLAFALAAQFNRVEIVRMLLDAGEDPNRYHPVGGHSHTTALHQAAGFGFEEMARLLVERGARLDMKDVLWHGTPADWARHAGNKKMGALLRAREKNRTAFLTFDGAVVRDPAIDAWMKDHAGELGAIAQRWFKVMRSCGDEVRELLHDGCPVACLGDAPFGYVNVFTSHMNVGFFHGAALRDPESLLQGTGKFMRHVKLTPAAATNDEALSSLIEAAYADIKERVENG